MTTIRVYLIDIKYKIERNISIILLCRDENGRLITIRDYYRPNFFIYPKKNADIIKLRTRLSKLKIDDKNHVTSTEVTTKKINNIADNFIHVFTSRPDSSKSLKRTIMEWDDVINIFEDDISMTRRYMIENKIVPFSLFEAEVVEHHEDQYYKLVNFLHKDIMFMEPQSISIHAIIDEFDKKTILALTCSSNEENIIFTTKPISSELNYIVTTSNEEDLLNRFRSFIIR